MEALQLEPLDVFSIRTAKPFDVGGITHAEFVWPPPPWTILGSLRGLLSELLGLPAVEYGHAESQHPRLREVVELLGPPDGPATFSIGPALVFDRRERTLRWPVPADVLQVKGAKEKDPPIFARLSATELPEGALCNLPQGRTKMLIPPPKLSTHPEKSVKVKSLDNELLDQWLKGSETLEPRQDTASLSEPDFYAEPRIGIRIDPATNNVAKGLFYVRSTVQLASSRVLAVPLVECARGGIPWQSVQGQVVRFGADGHLVRLTGPTKLPLPPVPAESPLNRARLLCVGPIHPQDVDQLQAQGKPVRVHAVAAGKPIRVGGWRLISRRRNGSEVQEGPRTLRMYYPAGTVLYVESEGDLTELHGQNLAADPEERSAGFGFCLVGRW